MVQGYTTSDYTVTGRRATITGENYDRHTHEQRHAYPIAQSKLPKFEKAGRENEGFMLNITGINQTLDKSLFRYEFHGKSSTT